jgi:hypothetical protein
MELLREVERLRGVIVESSRQASDALVALAADEHAWRPAIRVLASIAQREASSLATAVEGAARVGFSIAVPCSEVPQSTTKETA